MTTSTTIYEARDCTDPDQYYPVGLWRTLDEAIAALEQCDDPPDNTGGHGEEGFCRVQIWRRQFGFTDNRDRKLAEVTWTRDYDETIDEDHWTRELSRIS